MKKQTKYRLIRKITKITRDTAKNFWTYQIQFVATDSYAHDF